MRYFSLLLIFSLMWSGNTFGAQSATASGISQNQETAQSARFKEDVILTDRLVQEVGLLHLRSPRHSTTSCTKSVPRRTGP